MSTSNQWMQRLENVIKPSLEIPMWKHLPEFPFAKVAQAIEEEFQLSQVSIQPVSADWKEEKEFALGFGRHPLIQSIDLSPIAHPVFLIFSQDTIDFFSQMTLSNKKISDQETKKAYFEYLLARFLATVEKHSVYPSLHLQLSNHFLGKEEGYVIDLEFKADQKSIPFRIVCPKSFFHAFNHHMEKQDFSLFATTYGQSLPLSLRLEAGYTTLTSKEWQQVSVGDFLILDYCTYHPLEKKGSLTLSLHETPLFQIKLKEVQFKILDYIFYNEGYPMNEDEMEGFPEEELSSFGEEETTPESTKSEKKESIDTILSAEKVPLMVKVEVGQFEMPLSQLMQLKPGNTIPLSSTPEQGVTLTLSGVKIAKGELIQLGDYIGVKINEIKK